MNVQMAIETIKAQDDAKAIALLLAGTLKSANVLAMSDVDIARLVHASAHRLACLTVNRQHADMLASPAMTAPIVPMNAPHFEPAHKTYPGDPVNLATVAAQDTILKANEGMVTTLAVPRDTPRKELAAIVRKLFKQMGIKGVSVTTPNHSMAMAVDVTLPRRDDYVWLDAGRCEADPTCTAKLNNHRVHTKIGEILARAFPQHDDRSDSQSDHFDYKFSIH